MPATLLSFLAAAAYAAVVLHVFWSKRNDSTEAAFWLLVVALLPVAGVALYLFFGITRVERADRRIRAFRRADPSRTAPPDAPGGRFAARLAELGRFAPPADEAASLRNHTLDRLFPTAAPLAGNDVRLLRDGEEAYPEMMRDILSAKDTIRLQSFILNGDAVGRALLEALERKAREGVDVKVLFDSFGSFRSYFSPAFLRFLFRRIPNFSLRPVSIWHPLQPWRFQLRNHRKLLVIDGKTAYSGGVNISADNGPADRVPPNRRIHDLHCRITGPAVAAFTGAFMRDWSYRVGKPFADCLSEGDLAPPERTGATTLRVVPGGPGDLAEAPRKLFLAAAATARRTLVIATPYFVPGGEVVSALCMAAARGVDVRVVVPERNNHFYVDYASRNCHSALLRAGVRVFRRSGPFSHTKALLADGEWGFMGSSNCDCRSFRLNFELDFCYEGGPFLAQIAGQLLHELERSREVTLREMEGRGVAAKCLSAVCALLTPVL
jgi:cardiolipin synthase